MKAKFLISESFQALKSNIMRSLLTVVGIVVGIFSVTAMLALGAGLSSNVLDRLSSFVQGDLTVNGDITYGDFTWISKEPYVDHALAQIRVSNAKVIAFQKDYAPTVQSVIGDYAAVQKYTVVRGEVFNFADTNETAASAVVSDGFADVVKKDTNQDVLGQTITISGQSFKVVGVIKSNAQTFTRGDGVILLPYSKVVGTLSSTQNFSSVAVLLKDSSYYEIAGQSILESLNTSRQLAVDSKDVFTVETAQSFIETAQQTTQMISVFLGIVGGIALFVGGIGTMNMMLTTVTERTKEIGLRKAVGARDRDILLQILVESVSLTTFGGLIGIALSLGAAKIANQIFASSSVIKVLVNLQVMLLAALVSFVVGIVFGLYPARKASRLLPVDALRAE
jgi:putative ABC transport system permease protein